VLSANSGNLSPQVVGTSLRQRNGTVFVLLSFTHENLMSPKVHVLHSQATTFKQPQSCAIGQFDHQSIQSAAAIDVRDQSCDFVLG
jgi:hypothetical protein